LPLNVDFLIKIYNYSLVPLSYPIFGLRRLRFIEQKVLTSFNGIPQ
jgi:hypothetical protein